MPSAAHTVVLLTGGNLGDVAANMEAARSEVERRVGRVAAASKVYASPPWGFEAAEDFLNQVLVVQTEMEPLEVLDAVQAIEERLGRWREASRSSFPPPHLPSTSSPRYASRTMDIDILYYDDLIMDGERLSVPHPLIARREFALRPLCEVMPQWKDPRTGLTVEQMLSGL